MFRIERKRAKVERIRAELARTDRERWDVERASLRQQIDALAGAAERVRRNPEARVKDAEAADLRLTQARLRLEQLSEDARIAHRRRTEAQLEQAIADLAEAERQKEGQRGNASRE